MTIFIIGLTLIGIGFYTIIQRKLTIEINYIPLTVSNERALFFGLICFECAVLPIVFSIVNNASAIERYAVIVFFATVSLAIFGFGWALFFEFLHRLRFGPPGHERKRKIDKLNQNYKSKTASKDEARSIENEEETTIFLTDDGELIEPIETEAHRADDDYGG